MLADNVLEVSGSWVYNVRTNYSPRKTLNHGGWGSQ